MSEGEQGSGPASHLETLKARARLLGVEFSNNIGEATLRERINAKMAEVNGDAGSESTKTDPGDQIVQPVPGNPEIPAVVQGQAQPNPLETGDEQNPLDNFDDDIEEEEAPENEQELPGSQQADPSLLVQQSVAEALVAPQPAQIINPIAPVRDAPELTIGSGSGSSIGKPTPENQPMTLRQKIWNDNMRLVRVRIQNLDPKKKDLSGEIFTVANKYLGNVKRFVPYGEQTDDGWHIPYVIYVELASRKFLSISSVKDRVTKQVKVVKRWTKEFSLDMLPPLTAEEIQRLATAQAAAGSIDQNDSNVIL